MRQRQDLQSRWQALDGALVKAVSQLPGKRNADSEAALRKKITDVDSRLLAADARLSSEFPRFAEPDCVAQGRIKRASIKIQRCERVKTVILDEKNALSRSSTASIWPSMFSSSWR